MRHLGCSIYYWGEAEQNRLLVDAIAPWLAERSSEGRTLRFFFNRVDLRGPHLMCLLTVPNEDFLEARDQLASRLRRYLEACPSAAAIGRDELERRHLEGRGKDLCPIDREEGMEANNVARMFEQAPEDYPYWLTSALPDSDAFWDLFHELTLWVLGRLKQSAGRVPLGAAVQWVAGLDCALADSPIDAAEYWAYHASTLILTLGKRLEEEPEATLAALPDSIGEKNVAAFSRVFADTAPNPQSWSGHAELVRLAASHPDPRRRLGLLREAVHLSLKQLGVPVSLHIPLVLFAWNRNLQRIRAQPGG